MKKAQERKLVVDKMRKCKQKKREQKLTSQSELPSLHVCYYFSYSYCTNTSAVSKTNKNTSTIIDPISIFQRDLLYCTILYELGRYDERKETERTKSDQ